MHMGLVFSNNLIKGSICFKIYSKNSLTAINEIDTQWGLKCLDIHANREQKFRNSIILIWESRNIIYSGYIFTTYMSSSLNPMPMRYLSSRCNK